MSACVWPKKAKWTPKPSSSQDAGPDCAEQVLQPLLALSRQPVDDLRAAGRSSGLAELRAVGVLGDQALAEQVLEAG